MVHGIELLALAVAAMHSQKLGFTQIMMNVTFNFVESTIVILEKVRACREWVRVSSFSKLE